MSDPNPDYLPPRNQPTCGSCYFWQRVLHYSNDLNKLAFECHRYAPRREGFPQTSREDWCGDHQPKQVPKEGI
jgi:hypothetical protein